MKQKSQRKMPRCPMCKTSAEVMVAGERMFYCHRCRMQFDDDPNEGGDWDNRNPAKRLEREEARKAAQRRRLP